MHPEAKELYELLLGSLLLLTLLMVLFVISIFRQMRHRLSEYRQQVKKEIELIDKERTRISAELHDELGSGIATIGLYLTQLNEKYNHPLLNKAAAQVKRQQEKVREIARNLLPGILSSHGLSAALEAYLDDLNQADQFKIKKEICLQDESFHPQNAVHLYLVIREIITNSMKHSAAGLIQIRCVQDAFAIQININDNGKGFNTDRQSNKEATLGLLHIRSRLEILGAKFSLSSKLGEGTSVRIRVPIQNMKEKNEQKL
jgi:signal transduction histidine kinase